MALTIFKLIYKQKSRCSFKMNKRLFVFLLIIAMNNINAGPVVGGVACSACCAAVHAPEAVFVPFYLGMVGKCVTTCLEGLVPGLSPIPTDPRDAACLVAEVLIGFAPTA